MSGNIVSEALFGVLKMRINDCQNKFVPIITTISKELRQEVSLDPKKIKSYSRFGLAKSSVSMRIDI